MFAELLFEILGGSLGGTERGGIKLLSKRCFWLFSSGVLVSMLNETEEKMRHKVKTLVSSPASQSMGRHFFPFLFLLLSTF